MSYFSGSIFKYVETLYQHKTDTSAVSDRTEKVDIGALLDSMSPEGRNKDGIGMTGQSSYALTVMTVMSRNG